jgi:hypothetical protein
MRGLTLWLLPHLGLAKQDSGIKPDNNRDIRDPELFRITNIPVVVRFSKTFTVV